MGREALTEVADLGAHGPAVGLERGADADDVGPGLGEPARDPRGRCRAGSR